jgi:cell division protease FtsH
MHAFVFYGQTVRLWIHILRCNQAGWVLQTLLLILRTEEIMAEEDKKPNNPLKPAPNQSNKDPKNTSRPPLPKMPAKGFGTWFLMMAVMVGLYMTFMTGKTPITTLDYSPDFVSKVNSDKVSRCEIVTESTGTQYIRGELLEVDENNQQVKFRVDVIVTSEMLTWLQDHKVSFKFRRSSPVLQQLLGFLPMLVIMVVVWMLISRQMKSAGKGAMSFGKSRARLLSQDRNKVTFADVAGVEEAKEELVEVVDFLKDPKQFQNLGGKMPTGLLLSGPPGTGKTLLAKAVAGEADVPFFTISGSDFVEMFVGVGASRVRDMFEQGKKHAPCIIFIDEIDAVGRQRGAGIGGGHDEREQTLNALLVEMDGFDTQEGVIIVAATNRPDVLDSALLRPGRFDRQVHVDLPDLEGRNQILKIHVKKITLSDAVDLHRVARGTPGFSGADLMNLVNEAALLASRRKATSVEMCDMEEARDKVCWGRERRSHALDDEEKRLTAYHEAGHAIVMYHTPESEPIHKVTIIPRGRALGATMQLPTKDRLSNSKKRLESMLSDLMGGRAAEEIILKDVTTGAHNDIQRATQIARAMVCEYGMSELGPRNYGSNEETVFLGREVNRTQMVSDATALKIDQTISRILEEAYDRAKTILTQNHEQLEQLAQLLMEHETLDAKQVDSIMKTGAMPPEPPKPEPAAEPETTDETAAVEKTDVSEVAEPETQTTETVQKLNETE